MTAVLLDHETLGYGEVPVLDRVSFALAPGERVAVLGRSGAGKTTLLTAIYERMTAAGTRVALVPQNLALVPQLSVAKNALMGRLDDHGAVYNLTNLIRTRAPDRTIILDTLAELGLSSEADRAVEGLSGGQKQRTALARAFFRGGDTLIGDEPFSALDETQGKMLLERVVARFPTAVLALHDVSLAFSFATRIVGLRDGRIEIDAPPDAVNGDRIDALYRS